MKKLSKFSQGFTILELLVVIGVITILIAAVVVAVNPSRQFAAARDTQRRSDLFSITNAVYQYAVENNGSLTPNFPTTATRIGTTAGYDIGQYLVPTYLSDVPQDPNGGTAADTLYWVYQTTAGRIIASAASEVDPASSITVQR